MQYSTGYNNDPNTFGSGKAGFRTAGPFTTYDPATANAMLGEVANAVAAFTALNPASFVQLQTILLSLLNGAGGSTTLQQSSSTPVFATNKQAHDHPSSASNKWKLILELPVAASRWVRLYAGDETSTPGGLWAITWNAVWDPAPGAQSWSKDNTGLVSLALIADTTGLNWRQRAAGAGTFTTWTAGDGDLNIGGDLNVGGDAAIPTVTGNVNIAGSLDVGTDMFAADDVIAGNEFQYAPAASRTTVIPVMSALVESGGFDFTAGRLNATAGGITFAWPLKLPAGAVLGTARLMIDQAGSSGIVVQAVQQAGINWGAPGSTPSGTVLDTDTTNATVAIKTPVVDFGGLTVSPSEDYYVIATSGQAGDQPYALEINWTDPGPRNH